MSLRLLRAFALALSLPEQAFDRLYGEAQRTHQTDSLPGAGRYRQRAGRRRAQGLRLSQLPAAGRAKGLQVEVSEGRWIDAQPREDTFVVNIGELLELATNGYLRATVHRVETPPAGATGCRSPSSSARAWTRWCRCINCRRRWRRRRAARPAIRSTRCCATWGITT